MGNFERVRLRNRFGWEREKQEWEYKAGDTQRERKNYLWGD